MNREERLHTIGTTFDVDLGRDAVHVAVVSIEAPKRLTPGQHVDADGDTIKPPVGIVDPFLTDTIEEGEFFNLFLYPGTITSLTHNWSHPAFEQKQSEISAAEQWIREYAENLDVGYNDLVSSAEYYLEYGEMMCRGGVLEGISTDPEFWRQYAILKDIEEPTFKEAYESNFFTCSC